MENEIWLPVINFEDRYEVSNKGNVRGLYYGGYKRGIPKIKKPQLNKNGYLYVVLQDGSKIKSWQVHRLVLTVFDKEMPSEIHCCHINGIKTDNNISNLTWGTRKQNESHKVIHNTKSVGKKNGASKLNENQVLEIRELFKKGFSTNYISKKFNISQQNTWHICKNKTWKHL